MSYIVQVSHEAYDDASLSDEGLYGPFPTRDAADAFRTRLLTALPEDPAGVDGYTGIYVRALQSPRIRPAVRAARKFHDLLTEDEGIPSY